MQVKSNDIKNETEVAAAQFHLLRTESIEGQQIYIFVKLNEYPINQKINFQFGILHVFRETNQQIQCYRCELNSKDCLNEGIEWTQKYFDQITLSLQRQVKDINISFKLAENEPIACDYVMRISERLMIAKSNNEVCLLKAYLKHMPSLSTLDQFYKLTNEQMERKSRINHQLEDRIVQLQNQRQQLANDVDFISSQAKKREQEILSKFTLLINEKKQKIRELAQINGLMSNQIVDAIQIEQPIQQPVQQDINNHFSQFMVSQPMDLSQLFVKEETIKQELRGNPIKKSKI